MSFILANMLNTDLFKRNYVIDYSLDPAVNKEMCIQFNGFSIACHFYIYYVWLFYLNKIKNPTIAKNAKVIVAASVSALSCLQYVITKDISGIINYYWYDLVISIMAKNKIMIAHHIFTLYAISHCPSHVEYQNVINMMYYMKLSDVVLHHYKISNLLQLDIKYPKFIKTYQLITLSYTVCAWAYLRFYYCLTLLPLNTTEANIMLPGFLAVLFTWWYKLVKITYNVFLDLLELMWIDVIEKIN
jgi:hypothetical protein